MLRAILLAIVAMTYAYAADVLYVSTTDAYPEDVDPRPYNHRNLDAVFGNGNWDQLSHADAVAQLAEYAFVVVEGGYTNTDAFVPFMQTHRAALETYVADGGKLFVNSARDSFFGAEFVAPLDVGFGATLVYRAGRPAAQTDLPADHPIRSGPSGVVPSSWSALFNSHHVRDIVTGAGTTLITDVNGDTVLTEISYGAGLAWVGTFYEPSSLVPVIGVLRENMLAYMFAAVPPLAVPGRIEAEDADPTNGVGFNDLTAGNQGGAYRNDDLDVQATSDVDGGFNVGWINQGEWANYTIAAVAGQYDLTLRVASAKTDDKTIRLEVDGQPAGSVTFNTGGAGWQAWQDVVISDVALTGGTQSARLFFDDSSFNLNYLEFTAQSTGNSAPVVAAGSDALVGLPNGVVLAGSVTDDGLPLDGALSVQWTQFAGPGTASFVGADTLMPTVTFSAAGVYVLRLTANDGADSSHDDVKVTVAEALALDVTSIVLKGTVAGGDAPVVTVDGQAVTVNADGSWQVEVATLGAFSGQPRLEADDTESGQQVQRDVAIDEFATPLENN